MRDLSELINDLELPFEDGYYRLHTTYFDDYNFTLCITKSGQKVYQDSISIDCKDKKKLRLWCLQTIAMIDECFKDE